MLLVAGEALSHCIAASVLDMLAYLHAEKLQRTVLLMDCMSPVTGFGVMGQDFLQGARGGGVQILSLAELAQAGPARKP